VRVGIHAGEVEYDDTTMSGTTVFTGVRIAAVAQPDEVLVSSTVKDLVAGSGWGIPRGQTAPAVLVTAYRPDPARWTDDFLRRR
jgi:class 3 adenylate cyclase